MKKARNGTKIFVIGAAVLTILVALVQAYEVIPPYSVSKVESLPYGFSVCGDDNSTGGNGNGTGGSGNETGGSDNETGGNGNWTGGGNNETGGNGNWTGGNENETGGSGNESGGYDNETGGEGNETGGNNESGGLEPGEIHGIVFTVSNNSQIPLEDANVAILYNENFSDVWTATFTDQNGCYTFDSLMPGLYQIRASKQGYFASINTVDLHSNESIELNFVLEQESGQGYPHENITILNAIKDGRVGGEINVWQGNITYNHEILIYNGISITKLDVEKGAISFTVSGNESRTGKTVVLNVDSAVFNSSKDIAIEYDGEIIKMADNINDVLNPNDDGSNPEYLLTMGANGTQILVSIPHFSEHDIKVYSLPEKIVETLGGVAAVLTYISICAIVAVLFVSTIYIRRRF